MYKRHLSLLDVASPECYALCHPLLPRSDALLEGFPRDPFQEWRAAPKTLPPPLSKMLNNSSVKIWRWSVGFFFWSISIFVTSLHADLVERWHMFGILLKIEFKSKLQIKHQTPLTKLYKTAIFDFQDYGFLIFKISKNNFLEKTVIKSNILWNSKNV